MRLLVCGLFLCVAWAGIAIGRAEPPLQSEAGESRASGGMSRCPATPVAAADDKKEEATDPMSVNGACYVCHMTFVRESLSKSHLKAKVGCVNCHGVSAKHANDENIGATKPDITFPRGDIDGMCIKCHAGHNASARKVILRLQERKLSPKEPPLCTECHGEHKIMR